jgi:hypothetical protein
MNEKKAGCPARILRAPAGHVNSAHISGNLVSAKTFHEFAPFFIFIHLFFISHI